MHGRTRHSAWYWGTKEGKEHVWSNVIHAKQPRRPSVQFKAKTWKKRGLLMAFFTCIRECWMAEKIPCRADMSTWPGYLTFFIKHLIITQAKQAKGPQLSPPHTLSFLSWQPVNVQSKIYLEAHLRVFNKAHSLTALLSFSASDILI
jgi:hypothetical protein